MSQFRQRHINDDESYFVWIEMARLNILKCLSGDHGGCRLASSVCRYHQGIYTKHHQMSASDMAVLQEVVDYRFVIKHIVLHNNGYNIVVLWESLSNNNINKHISLLESYKCYFHM